ncbi:MAG: outer membrane lipoprotein chaperone LolA [Pseudomonadota bacterium]|nr:outer membrane lipoprotein chaperone LolA [Pseudomonadota bacterium]
MTAIGQAIRWMLLCLLMGAALSPTYAGADGHDQLDRFFEKVNTFKASFIQVVLDENLLALEESNGLLWIARPGRFRWDYESGHRQSIVADGEVLWLYDVELEQVTRREQESAIGQTPAVLLSGGQQYRKDYNVTILGRQGAVNWISLVPKLSDGSFAEIQFGFEGDTLRLIQLLDELNQITRVTLADVVENEPIPDSVFQFVPPTGVDVISDVE